MLLLCLCVRVVKKNLLHERATWKASSQSVTENMKPQKPPDLHLPLPPLQQNRQQKCKEMTDQVAAFQFASQVFISNQDGAIYHDVQIIDHPTNHCIVRLEQCPVNERRYILLVNLELNLEHMRTKRMIFQYDVKVWFRDENEKVCCIKNEETVFDSGRWMRLCVIDLRDELAEVELEEEEDVENDWGVLILPGAEDHGDGIDDDAPLGLTSVRIYISFTEVEEVLNNFVNEEDVMSYAEMEEEIMMETMEEEAMILQNECIDQQLQQSSAAEVAVSICKSVALVICSGVMLHVLKRFWWSGGCCSALHAMLFSNNNTQKR